MPFKSKVSLEKISQKRKFVILVLCDLLTFICAGIVSQFLITGTVRSVNILVFSFYVIAQFFALSFVKYYKIRISDGSVDLILRASVAIIAVFAGAFVIVGSVSGFVSPLARWSVVYTLFSLMGTMGSRYVYRMLGFYRIKSNSPKAIVYGAGNVGATMVRMSRKGAFGYTIIGFIDVFIWFLVVREALNTDIKLC